MNKLEDFIKRLDYKDDITKLFIRAEDATVRRSKDIFYEECEKLGIPIEIAVLYLQFVQHKRS